MPIPSSGQISLNDDVNATLQADTNEQDVSLKDNNAVKFTAVSDGDTVTGRSMSELRGQSLFQIYPDTEDTGNIGESLHLDGIESNHNSIDITDGGSSTAAAYTSTIGTFSFWVKINETESENHCFYSAGTSSSAYVFIGLNAASTHDKKLRISLNSSDWTSEPMFIDKTGWYNFVVTINTNIISGSEQVKAYANGLPLNFSATGSVTAGTALQFGTNQRINDWDFSLGYGLDAIYGNFVYVDGKALLPNEFGELKYGIWVPKQINKPSTNSLITNNLQLNYQFEGNANDSANSYDGTLYGPTFRSNNYGIYDFDGSNDYIQFTNPISNSSSVDLTFSCWINWDTVHTSSFVSLIGNNSSSQWGPFMIHMYGSSQGVSASFERYYSGNQFYNSSSSTVGLYQYTANIWYNLTFTLDSGNNRIYFYVNGELIDDYTISLQNTGRAQTTTSVLGIYDILNGSPRQPTDAQWGEVQIYSDALTATEVKQNYNATKHKYFYGLNGWHFNFNNTDQGSIVSGSDLKVHLDVGDWDADGTDETSFSGTAWNDKAGSHNFTLTGPPTYSSGNGGYFDFDDGDKASTSTTISNTFANNVTYEMWVNMDEGNNYTLVYGKQSASLNGILIGNFAGSAGNIEVYRYQNGSSSSSSATIYNTGLTTGKWQHLVFVMEDICRVYVDGALTATGATFNATYPASFTELNIAAGYSSSYNGNFKMAQFRVYSKALTAQEVVQNYRATQEHYGVLSLADISGNAKKALPAGTNLSGADHNKDKIESLPPSFKPEGKMTSEGILTNAGTTLLDSTNNSNYCRFVGPTLPLTGKWYWEVEYEGNGSGYLHFTGIVPHDFWYSSMTDSMTGFSSSYGIYGLVDNGAFYALGSNTLTLTSTNPSGAIIGFAYDADAGALYIYHNGTAQNSGNAVASSLSGQKRIFGQTADATNALNFNFGSKDFSYSIPSGYTSLASNNLPISTNVDPINKKKPTDHFKTVLYTGNNAFQKIRGLGFDPDFVWIKNTDAGGYHHDLYDTVRGDNLRIYSSQTNAQGTGYLQFRTDGFNLTSGGGGNTLNNTHVAWCWKAGGAATTITAGTVNSNTVDSSVSANTEAGFSIVSYTAPSSGVVRIAHGLGGVPEMVITKTYSVAGYNWYTWVKGMNTTSGYVYLDGDAADQVAAGYNMWNNGFTSTTYEQNVGASTIAGASTIGYLWRSIPGYQKIGTYSGNGNSNGPTIYTGFRPAWILIKNISTTKYWYIQDNKRSITNPRNKELYPNRTDGQATMTAIDFLSNGFKIITSDSGYNTDDDTYIYLAIAEDPAKYTQGSGIVSDTEKFLEKGDTETSYPENNFKTVHWTGNGSTKIIDDVGFKPGLVWSNARSFDNYSQLFDSIRGVTKELEADTTSGEATNADSLTHFTNDGFVLGSSNNENQNNSTYKAWCWKAGDTTVTKKPTYTSSGILTSNLVLHYNFADSNTYAGTGTTVYDLTSNDKDATTYNAPTWVDRANGNYFNFDGSNDYIQGPNPLSDIEANQSVEVWFNLDSQNGGGGVGQGGIIQLNGKFYLQYSSAINGLRVYNWKSGKTFYDTSDTTNNNERFEYGTLDNNKWYHIAFVKNGTDSDDFELYINGILQPKPSGATGSSGAFNGIQGTVLGTIGSSSGTVYNLLDGSIGQVRVYSAALTQSQIKANYDATRTLYQGVGTTGNVLQTGLLNNIDVDSFSSYDPNSFGATNKVAVFNGLNSSSRSKITTSGLTPSGNFSISFWINSDDVSTDADILMGTSDSYASNVGFGIYTGHPNDGDVTWAVCNGSSRHDIVASGVTAGQWHHIAITQNTSNNEKKLYINGALGASSTNSINVTGGTYSLIIGGYSGYDNSAFDGQMDQIRIFSSTLTADQIKILYNETSATTGTLNPTGISGCIALYNFNSDTGTTIDDVSTNYDGTFANGSFAFSNTTSGRAKDQTSNNLSGAVVNATFNESNNWGTSIKFDGSGDYVILPEGLGRTATQDVTREFWLKVDDYAASGAKDCFFYCGDMNDNGYYESIAIHPNGTIQYQERNNNSSNVGQDISVSTTTDNIIICENSWYHIVYTVSGKTKKIYINGKLQVASTVAYTKVNNSSYTASLGAFRGGYAAAFHGEIAQFRCYTSVLTDAQVKANFDATKAQFYSPLIHSLVSVNDKAGFSIVKYIGEGNETDIVSHGQSSAPDFIITKRYDASGQSWNIRTPFSKNQANSLSFPIGSNDKVLSTNGYHGYADYSMDAQTNTAGGEYISYCFRNIPGYMKFGQYIGDQGSTSPRIYTGFRPRFIVTKNATSGDSWDRWYFKDLTSDIDKTTLYPNAGAGGEQNYDNIDIFQDGFNIKANDDTTINETGHTFFYWAIA